MRSASSASMITAASASSCLSLLAMPRSTYRSPLSIPPPFSPSSIICFYSSVSRSITEFLLYER